MARDPTEAVFELEEDVFKEEKVKCQIGDLKKQSVNATETNMEQLIMIAIDKQKQIVTLDVNGKTIILSAERAKKFALEIINKVDDVFTDY